MNDQEKSPQNSIVLSVIMPALNEEKNILNAVDKVLADFKELGLKGEIIVVNDGSSDSTAKLVKERAVQYPGLIYLIEHDNPESMGACFYDGLKVARGNYVVMLPGDNENNPEEILRYLGLMDEVDIVVPFVYNCQIRTPMRNFYSGLFTSIINSSFGTSFTYTNGTVMYRRSILEKLSFRDTGFFFQTYLLVMLAKQGYLYAEVPSRLNIRDSGESKALTFKSFKRIAKGYLRLLKDFYFVSSEKTRENNLASDSVTARRKAING